MSERRWQLCGQRSSFRQQWPTGSLTCSILNHQDCVAFEFMSRLTPLFIYKTNVIRCLGDLKMPSEVPWLDPQNFVAPQQETNPRALLLSRDHNDVLLIFTSPNEFSTLRLDERHVVIVIMVSRPSDTQNPDTHWSGALLHSFCFLIISIRCLVHILGNVRALFLCLLVTRRHKRS